MHNGYIISNDRYWDHINKLEGRVKAKATKWIREHCISFTWVGNEFVPNPDFEFKFR